MSGFSDFALGFVLRRVCASFIALIFVSLLGMPNALAQQSSAKSAQQSAEQSPAPKGSTQPAKLTDEKSSQTPDVLVQLNSAPGGRGGTDSAAGGGNFVS